MLLTIELPERSQQLEFNRKRWEQVLCDSELASLPHRIETNAIGQIVVNPPPSGDHSLMQSRVLLNLHRLLGDFVLPECPISTIDGVRATDVAWYSPQVFSEIRGQRVFEVAPNICVEIASPSNSETELNHKSMLYFEAGATEVWIVQLDGSCRFFEHKKQLDRSKLCPDFRLEIS